VEVIKPLGLYNRRAKLLKEFSQDYVSKDWADPRELKGIGLYGWEAWVILMEDRTDITPTDSVLRRYLEWLATQPGRSRLVADLDQATRQDGTR
jgi:methyl-CpG-binding domain protein 4